MTDCPVCVELRELAEMAQRMDWRAGRKYYQLLVEHQTRDHCLHVATAISPASILPIDNNHQ